MTAEINKEPILVVRGLTTEFQVKSTTSRPVNDVSFNVVPGQVMGLVGESGSGKSMTAYSIMGLVEPPGVITKGEVIFRNVDLRGLKADAMRAIRGDRIAMIFQDPMMALNPVLRIDTQMIETVQAHQHVSRGVAISIAREALVRVGIASPDERLAAYPHQFSGGMRQRVAIVIALLNKPDLIICDEPTTALEVTIQAQILFEMQKLCRDSGTALIWITHDLSVVAGFADTVYVMYAGRIIESGSVAEIISKPAHPYTAGLINSSPSKNVRGELLRQIYGAAPSLAALPKGCSFTPRCLRATDICNQLPLLDDVDGHSYRCFHPMIRSEVSV